MISSKGKKIIAILAGPLDNQSAGVHVYTKELITALSQNENSKHRYVLIRERKGQNFQEFKQIVLPTIDWLPGYATFRLFFLIPFVCRWLKVDAVFEPAHFGPFNLPKRIKRITAIHDLTPILFPKLHTFNGWFLHKLFLPRIMRKADLIIASSSNTKNDVEKTYPISIGKIKTILLGVSDNFQPKMNPDVLTKYAIQQPFFLSVGTIEPRKNLNLLLDAFETFKNLKDDSDNHQLVFIGKKGWKNEDFFKKLEKHPYKSAIKILGYVPFEELPIFYTMCFAFIYPSLYEGFGLPVAEALSCNARCFVAKNSSLVEVGGEEVDFFETKTELIDIMMKADISKNNITENNNRRYQRFSWKNYSISFEKHIDNL